MSLQFTAAASSRIKKSGTRSQRSSSLFDRHRRVKSSASSVQLAQKSQVQVEAIPGTYNGYNGAYMGTQLPDLGSSQYISDTTLVNSVIQAIQYVHNTMFTAMPDSRTGMNSTRIAEVLNFRRSLPPIVSMAHVHVLLNAPTKVERQIAELVESARVRRLFIPGRGSALAGLGDCLVLVEDWELVVRRSGGLDESLKEKFIQTLHSNSRISAISAGHFTPEEASSLIRAGFLVSPSSLAKDTSTSTSLAVPPPPSAQRIPNGATQRGKQPRENSAFRDSTLVLSLPNLGPYLRLLSAARSQMLAILDKSKFGEAPLSLLKDRWDGAVESQTPYGAAKRARGESSGVLPGRTKKWKELYGMRFRWALEEALGAGLIEIFDTGSVGPAARRL